MKNYRRTLFVCTGNIFRSIVAEKLFIEQATSMGLHYQARSRGTEPYFDAPNPLLADLVLRRYSIDIKIYRPRKLTEADILWASVIICFTHEHFDMVLKLSSSAENKAYLLEDITFIDKAFFEDIDYRTVSETNGKLLKSLGAIALAIHRCLHPRTLSIAIPVYNEEKTIGNILRKLLSQSTSDYLKEIVVVSSGSTDCTDLVVESVKSPKVVLVKEEMRSGKVNALKKSIPFVTGENILLLDGDMDIEGNFMRTCFQCIYDDKLPCTGRVVPTMISSSFFYKLSVVGCEAWNNLRAGNHKANAFLYPSGYVLLLSNGEFADVVEHMDGGTINDDGSLAFFLFQKGIIFRYCDQLKVYVVFPQTFRDFFRQKIRTRMGRRQTNVRFFKDVERQWREELIRLIDRRSFFFVCFLLLLDFVARCAASVKIKIGSSPHLWRPAPSTKHLSLS